VALYQGTTLVVLQTLFKEGFKALRLSAAEACFSILSISHALAYSLLRHRAGVDALTEQSRRDGTACSPAWKCRVAYGLEASPGGTAHPG
jgi:hypothetical protein